MQILTALKYSSLTSSLTISFLIALGVFIGIKSPEYVYASNIDANVPNIYTQIYGIDTDGDISPKIITVKIDGYVIRIFTLKTDIFEILDDYDIPYDHFDTVVCTTPTIQDGSIVKVVRIKKEIVSKIVDIPFKEKEIKTYKYYLGESNIVQRGVLGAKTQIYENYYEDGELISSTLLSENITRQPTEQIIEVGENMYSLEGITLRGYNCPYWYSIVDAGPYTDKEKQWLKFVMYCESGCNAESNKNVYKGLFQWNPSLWRELYPNENIFDGEAQIRNTVTKIRMGVQMDKFWPACHARYVDKYGEY